MTAITKKLLLTALDKLGFKNPLTSFVFMYAALANAPALDFPKFNRSQPEGFSKKNDVKAELVLIIDFFYWPHEFILTERECLL